MNLFRRTIRFLRCDDGVTSVEYCVMLAFVLLIVIAGVTAAGGGVSGWWNDINSDLDTYDF